MRLIVKIKNNLHFILPWPCLRTEKMLSGAPYRAVSGIVIGKRVTYRNNKMSLPPGKMKKYMEFACCISNSYTAIRLWFKHLDSATFVMWSEFSWVLHVWTDICIHHQRGKHHFLSVFYHFLLIHIKPASPSLHITTLLVFLCSCKSLVVFLWWRITSDIFSSYSSLIVLLQIFSILYVTLNPPLKSFKHMRLFHLCSWNNFFAFLFTTYISSLSPAPYTVHCFLLLSTNIKALKVSTWSPP